MAMGRQERQEGLQRSGATARCAGEEHPAPRGSAAGAARPKGGPSPPEAKPYLDVRTPVTRKAEEPGDLPIDCADNRITPIEIARVARAEVRDTDVVGDLRRTPPLVDPLDERRAGRRLTPGEQHRGAEHRKAAGADRNGSVGVGNDELPGRRATQESGIIACHDASIVRRWGACRGWRPSSCVRGACGRSCPCGPPTSMVEQAPRRAEQGDSLSGHCPKGRIAPVWNVVSVSERVTCTSRIRLRTFCRSSSGASSSSFSTFGISRRS